MDREEQIKLFEQLLTCTGSLRVLVISQQAEFGKSELLRKLRRHCEPPVVVSFVTADPDKNEGVQDPMRFVFAVKKDLESAGLNFPLTNSEAQKILPQQVTVNAQGANFGGATGVEIIGAAGGVPQLVPMTPEQRLVVLEAFYLAFFNELVGHTRNETVVILIDAFEKWKRESDIYEWFHARFLKRLFFGGPEPTPNLVLIVAGQTKPTFDEFPDRLVESRVTTSKLEPWSTEQSLQYFRLVMHREPDEIETELFDRLAAKKLPPGVVAANVDAIRANEQGQ